MRTVAEIEADATDRRPFANHTEYEVWRVDRCDDCYEEPTCKLILVALNGHTPKEWKVVDGEVGDCSEFEPIQYATDDEPEDPDVEFGRRIETVHIPVLDGQLDLFGGGS